MKDTFYFSHDYNSRTDDKIKCLIRKHGMLGYGLFWAIIEDLYNNANALRTDYEGIAYELRTNENIVKSIIEEFDLFKISDGFFGSLSVQRRLEERNSKSIKAKESAFKRWNKDANALPPYSECNAIKEIKESKGNESIFKPTQEQIEKFNKFKEYIHQETVYSRIAMNLRINPNEILHCVNEFTDTCYGSIIEQKHVIGLEQYFINWVKQDGMVLKCMNNQHRKNGKKQ